MRSTLIIFYALFFSASVFANQTENCSLKTAKQYTRFIAEACKRIEGTQNSRTCYQSGMESALAENDIYTITLQACEGMRPIAIFEDFPTQVVRRVTAQCYREFAKRLNDPSIEVGVTACDQDQHSSECMREIFKAKAKSR